MRLLLAAFGRVIVDLAVLESEHDNSDDEASDDGPVIGLGAQVRTQTTTRSASPPSLPRIVGRSTTSAAPKAH